MSDIDVNQLLNQMREMAAAAQSTPKPQPNQQAEGAPDFAALLKSSVDQVNTYQKASGKLTTAFVNGDPNVSLSDVMIAKQKSSVAFTAMTEVRNKLVEAYRKVMNSSM